MMSLQHRSGVDPPTMIDEVDLLEILLWDFVWPVENIPSFRGGRSQVKPAIPCWVSARHRW